ncbi:MAG: PQQ-binding-like beta-propeller repeat protein [Vicinamibacterales bacterium]|nr:PQQ-binding-like beta-propeller repeat protein [Vicinamibacterales bacterium]
MRSTWTVAIVGGALFLAFLGRPGAQNLPLGTDWPMYRHDQAGTGYSPLTQIDATNVTKLARSWTYSLQANNSQATPIVVNGVMYLPAANRVVALDPETGKEIWQRPIPAGAPSRRGVAYWPGDAANPPRVIFTAGRRLMALDAATGAIANGFGSEGEVDLVVPYNSVPLVYKNIVVVGANTPPPPASAPGNARAFDARTGAKLWEFNSVAGPGTVGESTWEADSWKGRSGLNAWPFYFTLDEQRGLLYLPLASASFGNYGGDRKGANLFGNSVVAVDVQTGTYKWHFQTIHHDLWDADPPAPPGLIDVVQNGRTIPAAALTTKSGYLYLLNRETGRPIFGVEERPVPRSDVPGEQTFPTQPFPVKVPPIARVDYKPADLVTADDTSAEHVKACQDLMAKVGGVYNAGPFTPWLYRAEGAAAKSTLVFPGMLGGANWGGTASDPGTGYVFAVTQDNGSLGWVEKTKEGSPTPYQKNFPERAGFFDVPMPGGGGNWPCQKPPWGRLIAVNASTGSVAWQVRLGITDQLPEGKQNTGRPVLAGPIVTASGLLFIASTDDNRFRALDAKTGKELWVTKLERRGNADPITYRGRNGKQYVAVVATDSLVVYALP